MNSSSSTSVVVVGFGWRWSTSGAQTNGLAAYSYESPTTPPSPAFIYAVLVAFGALEFQRLKQGINSHQSFMTMFRILRRL